MTASLSGPSELLATLLLCKDPFSSLLTICHVLFSLQASSGSSLPVLPLLEGNFFYWREIYWRENQKLSDKDLPNSPNSHVPQLPVSNVLFPLTLLWMLWLDSHLKPNPPTVDLIPSLLV